MIHTQYANHKEYGLCKILNHFDKIEGCVRVLVKDKHNSNHWENTVYERDLTPLDKVPFEDWF